MSKNKSIILISITIIIFIIAIVEMLFLIKQNELKTDSVVKINSLADYKTYANQINSYKDVSLFMGREGDEIGSGLYIFSYKLLDGSINFSFTDLVSKPIAVTCADQNFNVLDCITLVKIPRKILNYKLSPSPFVLPEDYITFETDNGEWYLITTESLFTISNTNIDEGHLTKIVDFPNKIETSYYDGDNLQIPYYYNNESNILTILSYIPFYTTKEYEDLKSNTSVSPKFYLVDLKTNLITSIKIQKDFLSKYSYINSILEIGISKVPMEGQYAICGKLRYSNNLIKCFIAELQL
jgi:hypothetical protein